MRTVLLTILLVLALRGSGSNNKPRPRPTPAPTATPTATPIPTPTQTPRPTSRPAPTPVACLPAQAPPPPVDVLVCDANAQEGVDLGQKINVCEAKLGARAGEIRARPGEGAAGRLDTQVTVSHTLRFAAGKYPSRYKDSGADGIIRLKDGARLIGAGMCETTLYESSVGTQGAAYDNWTVAKVYANSVDNDAVARDVHISDIGIAGANPDWYGGPQTISLGNCHGCSVRRVKLKGTTTIGIQAGSGSARRESAVGVRISDNVLESVAGQSLACTNCVNVTFENNLILNPGGAVLRRGSTGSTPGNVPIDLEPNTGTDKMRNVIVRGNTIDASDSLASCGASTPCTLHGIVVQRVGVAAEDYSVEITNNRIIGARITDPSPRISGAGIWITNVPNVRVTGNYIQRTYTGILVSSSSDFEVSDNELVSTGFTTNGPIIIEGGDVSGVVRGNVLRADPASALYAGENTSIWERATSGAVTYSNNRMSPSPGGRGYFLRLPGSRSDEPPQVMGAPRKK